MASSTIISRTRMATTNSVMNISGTFITLSNYKIIFMYYDTYFFWKNPFKIWIDFFNWYFIRSYHLYIYKLLFE